MLIIVGVWHSWLLLLFLLVFSSLCWGSSLDTFCNRKTRFEINEDGEKYVAYYKKGKRVGTWIFFDKSQNLAKIEYYRRGNRIKQLFYVQGVLRETRYKNGRVQKHKGCGC